LKAEKKILTTLQITRMCMSNTDVVTLVRVNMLQML